MWGSRGPCTYPCRPFRIKHPRQSSSVPCSSGAIMLTRSNPILMGALRCRAVLLLVPLVLFLQTADAKKPDKLGKIPDSLPQGSAKDVLKRLHQRLKESRPDRERLRLDLLALCRAFPGSKESVEAFALLRELPSPLDKLDGRVIPALERY